MNNWNWNLDELVDKVMADLRKSDVQTCGMSVSAVLTRDFRSIQSRKSEEKKEIAVCDASKGDSLDGKESLNEIFTLSERVVFSDVVRKFAAQTESKRWKVCSGAVITPSARDELKKRNIELVVGDADAGTCDGSKRAVLKYEAFPKSRVTVSASNAIGVDWGTSKKTTENKSERTLVFLANHLPEEEKFPLNVRDYLARNASLTEVRFTCLKEASRRIQNESDKDKSLKTVLVTRDGAIASIWCNRLSGVRAVAAFSYDQVCYDLEATNANVVIVDPSRVGSYQFRRIVDYFLRSEAK